MTLNEFDKLYDIVNNLSYNVIFNSPDSGEHEVRIIERTKHNTFNFLCNNLTEINDLTLNDIDIDQFEFNVVTGIQFDEIDI